MKKSLFITALAMSLVACKKNGTAEHSLPDNTIDSLKTEVVTAKSNDPEPPVVETAPQPPAPTVDSTQTGPVDTVQAASPAPPKESPTSSSISTSSPTTLKVVVQPQKVIRENKIIYKDAPRQKVAATESLDIHSTASLSLSTENIPQAIREVKETASFFKAKTYTEEYSGSHPNHYATIEFILPERELLPFLETVERNPNGVVTAKSTHLSGKSNYAKVTLAFSATENASDATPTTFSGKMWSGIQRGAEVMGNVLLFIMPLWPLFLLAAGAWYFTKRIRK